MKKLKICGGDVKGIQIVMDCVCLHVCVVMAFLLGI